MVEHDPLDAALSELVESVDEALLDVSGPVSEEEVNAAERALGVPLPQSYRRFLGRYGAATFYFHEVLGICRDGLWGDVVRENRSLRGHPAGHYVQFTPEVAGYRYCLDTSRMGPDGECPVVVFGPGEDGTVVADNFFEFLLKARAGAV